MSPKLSHKKVKHGASHQRGGKTFHNSDKIQVESLFHAHHGHHHSKHHHKHHHSAYEQIRVGKSATKAGIKAISKDKESSEKLLKLKSNLKMLKKATESAVASKASKKALAKPKKKLLKEV